MNDQIQRYLRLNALLPELLQMVDEGRIIALTPRFRTSLSHGNGTVASDPHD